MMDELVQFLRARLDEDEWIARAATPRFRKSENRSLWIHSDSAVIVTAEYFEDAAHIARHDPARVLRDIEAKRGIVDDLSEVIGWGERKGPDYQDGVDACERTLKWLALSYADHPDYHPEWRP